MSESYNSESPMIDLMKGQTPADIEEKCLKLCQNYLSGIWCQQNLDTIRIERISGGMTNQLYYCGSRQKSNNDNVPQEVAIRLYGPKYFDSCDNDSNERFSDLIIGLMISENNLGPKLYGLFEDGQIQKFYQHRQFKANEQNNVEIVRKVAQRLAQIHAMNVPIKRNPNWQFKVMNQSLEKARQKFPLEVEMNEYNCVTLKTKNIDNELIWMNRIIENVNSPVVFTHNDFRSSNLMITEPNDELIVCDFEIAGYGYRGHDFVALMREWNRNPFDFISIDGLPPEDTVFGPIIEMYIEESAKIFGESYAQNDINSVESLLKEIKTFLLNSILFGVIFMMKNDENDGELPFNRRMCMEFSEMSYNNYFLLKQKLIDQKIIVDFIGH